MKTTDKELERVIKALANSRRIAIVRHVMRRREVSVGDIAEAIRLSLWATSRHLSRLYAAGILEKEQRSLQMFYRIADDIPTHASKLIAILKT